LRTAIGAFFFNALLDPAPNFLNREIASASPAHCHSSTPVQPAAERPYQLCRAGIHAALPETHATWYDIKRNIDRLPDFVDPERTTTMDRPTRGRLTNWLKNRLKQRF
jgi:hypothetical protein